MKNKFVLAIAVAGLCLFQIAYAETPNTDSQGVTSDIKVDSSPNETKSDNAPSETDVKHDTYVSLAYGTVKTGNLGDNVVVSNEIGALKEVEFYWGSKDYASYIGGIRQDQNGKMAGYYFSYVFKNKDIISINQWSNDGAIDMVSSWNPNVSYSLGNYSATRVEYSYISETDAHDAFTRITYGRSNFPISLIADGALHSPISGSVDANPDVQYIYFMYEANPMRSALLNGTQIKDQKFANEDYYFIDSLGISLEQVQLSSNQAGYPRTFSGCRINCYNTGTSDRTVTIYDPAVGDTFAIDRNPGGGQGLNNQSGMFITAPIYLETGLHFSSIRSNKFSLVGTLGAYMKYALPIGAVFKLSTGNQLSTGEKWYPDISLLFGANARLSVLF